jgi:nitric oxide reductase subunit B
LVSKIWIQAVALIVLCGFSVLGLLAVRTYTDEPPIPGRVVSVDGPTLYTGADVLRGQQVFLHNGLMEYGSVFGHGAYLGPDFTDDYLHRAAQSVTRQLGDLDSNDASAKVIRDFQANRYDEESKTLTFTREQARAFEENLAHYTDFFGSETTGKGLRPRAITNQTEIRQLTAFFSWSAWAASARREGKSYSYTNNWPPEPLVGNHPTANAVVWSVLSLIALLAGVGALFGAFGRWGDRLGWRGRQAETIEFRSPDSVRLTPAQRATAWFFLVVGGLFLVQTLVGAASEHYRADLTSFFGIDLARLLPFNLARTWHLQLALFWVAAAFLAAGIFLAPIIAGREPPRQHLLAYALLGAVTVVVVGSLVGEALSIHGVFSEPGSFFESQGFEYLDLARVWQVLLTLGLFVWVAILFRGLRHRLRESHPGNMPWLFFLSALAIPAFYAVGLLARSGDNFTHADFWRFWVVHLWVEDFLELFTTVMVAYIFVMLGVIRETVAMTVIYLDIVLYSAGGVIGTMHHVYFSGEPAEHMALGAFFSAAEVIPLTFLTVEAWSFLQLGARQRARSTRPFPHRWAVMFLVAVGFWNFLGAGIFGFLINLPIVSYYEIGTALTANHGHAAMMGVYGMLAMGLALFCLRYLIPENQWPDRLARLSFWATNLGLAWMCFATLLPVGLLQLHKSVESGYHAARSLEYISNPTNSFFEWLRLPGDVVFIAGGVVPFLWICFLGVRHVVRRGGPSPETVSGPALFTDVTTPAAR